MKKERIFWGCLFILCAIALIVGKLGYFSGINAFSITATVFLVGIIIRSLFRISFAGILFPIAFICIIYDKQLGITDITPWTVLLTALLGSIGLYIIFYKKSRWYGRYTKWNSKEEIIDIEDDSHIRFQTSFAESIKYINTDKFEQADLKCHFGSMKIYFDNATLLNGRGIVRMDASFSGIELYVPKTWGVDNRVSVHLGGVNEKNKNLENSENVLTLVGRVDLAGVEIIYI